MGWLRRRELGAVDAILVQVHGPGTRIGRRVVRPGRVAVTFEDVTGLVIVEADTESMAAMLARAGTEVEAFVAQQQAMWDRVTARVAARERALLDPSANDHANQPGRSSLLEAGLLTPDEYEESQPPQQEGAADER
jgi:hypothetical protein